MNSILNDIRYSLRMFRKNFLFFAFVVLTLAIGIGANTAIFSLLNAVLLKPLPFSNPDRLVTLWETNREKGITADTTSASNFIDWRDRTRSFSGMAAASRISSVTLTGEGPAKEITWSRISPNFFELLGVKPLHGRSILSDADQIAISHGFWQRQFGSNKKVIGTHVLLDNQTYQIAAVLPEWFESPSGKADVWGSLILDRARLDSIDRGQNYLRVFARLKLPISIEQAQQDLNQIAKQLSNEFPDSNRGSQILMISLMDQIVGGVKPILFVAFAAVGIVLLIACINAATLVLTYFTRREHEIAIRAALGASRKRVATQFLIESLLISLCAGLIGILFARFSFLFLLNLNPEIIPRLSETNLGLNSMLFTFLISILTGVLFGVVPALRASEPARSDSWKIKSGGIVETRKTNRLRNRFVVFEIAIALFLLMGAGLFVRSFYFLQDVDSGFAKENLLVARIRLDDHYAENGKQIQYFRELVARLKSIPGITEAGAVTVLPMNPFGIDFDVPYHRAEQPEPQRANASKAKFRSATPDYFRAMHIPVLRGRAFANSDIADTPRVVIVNEDLAKQISPGSSPIGKKIRFFWADWQTYEIVGVVGNTRTYGPLLNAEPELFVPFAQIPYIVMNIVVRTVSNPEVMTAAVSRTVLEIDPDQPVQSIEPMTSLVKNSTLRERYAMLLMAILSVVALILAITGIYATVYFAVTQRKSEMGIRIALGATSSDVLKAVLYPIVVLTMVGILFGQTGVLLLTRFLSGLLFGISPTDLLTLISVTLLMIAAALIAAYIPARRVTKLDPAKVLREL